MTDLNDNKGISKTTEEDIMQKAYETVLQIEGVNRLSGGIADNLSKNIFGIEPSHKGIKLSRNDDGLIIDIYIVVEYLSKIPQLAWDIQSKVKKKIEEFSGLTVLKVDIHVQGVESPGEENNDKN